MIVCSSVFKLIRGTKILKGRMSHSIKDIDFLAELAFKTTTSSGKGGQHVNKVSSRAVLKFNVYKSELLSKEQKEILTSALGKRLDTKGNLQMSSQKTRSQHQNKTLVIERFYSLLENALLPETERIPTKPTRGSKVKRIKKKKHIAEKKQRRQKPGMDSFPE